MQRCVDCIHYKACNTWVKIWLGVETEFPYKAESNLCEHFEIPKHGEWITNLDGTCYCSECGHDEVYTYDGTRVLGIACLFCGAKMDKEN